MTSLSFTRCRALTRRLTPLPPFPNNNPPFLSHSFSFLLILSLTSSLCSCSFSISQLSLPLVVKFLSLVLPTPSPLHSSLLSHTFSASHVSPLNRSLLSLLPSHSFSLSLTPSLVLSHTPPLTHSYVAALSHSPSTCSPRPSHALFLSHSSPSHSSCHSLSRCVSLTLVL